jgi:hypothetical protein
MKTLLLCLFFVAPLVQAQVVPTTPTKFETKGVGVSAPSASVGLSTRPAPPPVVRTTTYFTLTDARQWTSAEGKPLLAKLIAWEDLIVEQVKGTTAPAAPTPPAHPTIVRDGKLRMMVNQQVREVPLDRLCDADRAFVETLQAQHAVKK